MKPIIYEIRRSLTSKFVIIMIVAIVGLSSLLAYESGSTFSPVSIPAKPSLTYGYYINGNSLTVVGYDHNAYGSPFPHVTDSFTYNGSVYNATSGLSGFANVTIPIDPSATISLYVNYTYKEFRLPITTSLGRYSINTSITYSGLQMVSGLTSEIYNPTNKSDVGLELFYVGPDGATAPSYTVYIGNLSSSFLRSPTTDYTFKYVESGFTVLNVFPDVSYSQKNITFAALAENATGVPSSPKIIGPMTFYSPITQSELQSLVFSGTSAILGFLIPILAVFAGYLTYGKDRTSGVLESVLKRPVTRGGLIFSRFVANAVAIIIAVGVSMIFSDLIIDHYFSMYLSDYFSLYFVWTYVVEGLAFLGIVYMFSHIVKSQGALLGASIAVFIVLDLFWSIIPVAILAALGVSSSSNEYVLGTIAFDYISPSGFSSLVQTMFTGKIGLISSISIDPSSYGLVSPLLILVGILWIAVPFAIAFNLARKRD